MVKSYLTKRQAYEAPDTSVTKIQLELSFADSLTKQGQVVDPMTMEEIEDEVFE